MDPKVETIRSYDLYSERFEERFRIHFERFVIPHAQAFLDALPGTRVLDIGCGAGDHAAWFAAHGCDVTCGDLSQAMVDRCRAKGLDARVMDLEALDLSPRSFDGIWAYASLLHIPKDRIQAVIRCLADTLVDGGILGVAMKSGVGEAYETKERYPDTQRFFAFYNDAELRELFTDAFDVIASSATEVKEGVTFLNLLLKKRA